MCFDIEGIRLEAEPLLTASDKFYFKITAMKKEMSLNIKLFTL